MLFLIAAAAITAADPVVSTAWVEAHLNDPNVRVIYVGEQSGYDRGHIPGARLISHLLRHRHARQPDVLGSAIRRRSRACVRGILARLAE